MKVTIITGVCGTTGSQILDYLLDENEEIRKGERVVIGLDNLFRGNVDNIKSHINDERFCFICKPFQYLFSYDVSKNFGEVDEIYHMAAVVPTKYFYERPDLTYEENCKGTIDLFNWAVSIGVKRFIEGSSSEIYGHISDDNMPAKETNITLFDSVEDTTRWSYAEGKLLVEHYLDHFSYKVDRVCHLRFANTYGVRDLDDNHVLPYLVNRVVRNEDVHINCKCEEIKRTFLNNRDSARACIELMSKGRNGVAYNVGSDEEVTMSDLLDLVVRVFEEESGIHYSGNVFKDISRPGDPVRRVLDTSRLRKDTGFVPSIILSEGVREMVIRVMEEVKVLGGTGEAEI